jgi:hypothetical protein
MVTMSNLGTNGRLGNQIFQFAFLYALHKLNGYDYCIPPNTDLIECFDLDCKTCSKLNLPKQKEKHFFFDQSFPQDFADNKDYSGYYQSDRYFDQIKSELVGVLKFKNKHKKPLSEDNLVSIHIRRGDYVGNTVHPVVSLEYINEAKKHFPNQKFLVFSDDIKWCKQNKLGDLYSEENTHYQDLYQMTLCTGSIIANSSFSWWGAYLTSKHKVVAPKNWFSNHLNTKDIYCKDWIIL